MSEWIRTDPESQALLAEELRSMAEADHAPNRCCDFHRHIADGCCHCDPEAEK